MFQLFLDGDKRDRYYGELLLPIIISLILLFIRYILEKYVFIPFGTSLGLKSGHENRRTVAQKFGEISWRLLYACVSTVGGIVILWDKPWFWDVRECWVDYYNQTVPNDVWWYYTLSASFWWSQLFSLKYSFETGTMIYIHHIAVILIVIISWFVSGFRIFTLMMFCNDSCKICYKGSKLATCVKEHILLLDIFFIMFVILYVITRIGIFPFYLVRSATVDVPELIPASTSYLLYYVGLALLYVLCILNFIWLFYLLKLAEKLFVYRFLQTDSRSNNKDE